MNHRNTDSLPEHPLFRALVVMGGALALNCGGSARDDSPVVALDGGGAPAIGGSSNVAGAPTTEAGSTSLGGGGTAGGGAAGAPASLPCAYAQWDFSKLAPDCGRVIEVAELPSGVFCNAARPVTAADCNANEALFCMQAFDWHAPTDASTWDGSFHVQCSCLKLALPATDEAARAGCMSLFPSLSPAVLTGMQPSATHCDANSCTATSADVLRQDGIMCGCASVALK